MKELFRDTVVGHLIRLVTGGKWLPHAEDLDPSLWRMYISTEKSSRLSSMGTLGPLIKPKYLSADTSYDVTPQSEKTEQSYPSSSSASPTRDAANYVDFAGSNSTENQREETEDEIVPAGKTGPPDVEIEKSGGVTAAHGQEGMNVSMQEGQVDGDPALHMHSEAGNKAAAWDAVQLEAGTEGVAPPEDAKMDPTKGRVVNVVVWFGPNDPENPSNWSHLKRAFVTAQIYLLTLSTYIGTSIFSPGASNVEEHFGVSPVVATLGTTLAILGYGLGVMFWSPLSEAIRLGRKPIYMGTLFIFVALQIPTVLATNIEMLLIFRFLGGIFGSPVLAIGGASINDMYTASERGYVIVMWDVVSIAAPVLGPLVGGFAAEHNGWRWTIWTMMWLSGGTLILLLFLMPETNQSNILYRRSRRLRVLTGNATLKSEKDVLGGQVSYFETFKRVLIRPFVLAFTEPILIVLNTYIALLNALLFSSLASFPLVFQDIYGFNLGQNGLAYLGMFCGSIIAVPPMFLYLHYRVRHQFNANGDLKPERRLAPAIVGAFIVPISLFIFGWTAREDIHWIFPILGSGLFGVANLLLYYAILNYIPDTYTDYSACAFAGNECLRSTAGAVFPLFATAMFKNLGIAWASTLLALLSCLFIPVPIVLYYKGHVIRGWSKYAKQDF